MGYTLGIIPARKGSKRLKDKNIKEWVNSKTLVDNAYETMIASDNIENVVVSTDYELHNLPILKRPEHLTGDDIPIQDVIRDVITSLRFDIKYDSVVVMFPTNPLLTTRDIDAAINMLNDCEVVRSYDISGRENGIYAIRMSKLYKKNLGYDVYTGAMVCNGKEIHTEEDFNEVKSQVRN